MTTGNEQLTFLRPPIPAAFDVPSKALMLGLTQRRIEPSLESYGSLLNAYAKAGMVGLEPGTQALRLSRYSQYHFVIF